MTSDELIFREKQQNQILTPECKNTSEEFIYWKHYSLSIYSII